MPTLVLPPRITPDTDAVLAAAQAAGWKVLRLESWRVPAGLNQPDVVLYGEPLFADVVAGALGGTKRRLELPTRTEGFAEISLVRIDDHDRFVVEAWRDAV